MKSIDINHDRSSSSRKGQIQRERGSLPEEYREHWREFETIITERIEHFRRVPREEYFFELLYCLLTPQSRAANAEQVIRSLKDLGFPEREVDPVPILRDPSHYIRFHNQKSNRLLRLRDNWDQIEGMITSDRDQKGKRAWLVENVNGLGWKEASHFLRNIGNLELAIIDRHILKHLFRSGTIDIVPKVISKKTYLDIEEAFFALAESYGLHPQELDLLFWSYEEGSVRK